MDDAAETGEKRYRLLDVMRGVALCGILPINMLVMGTISGTDGLVYPVSWNSELIAWCFQQLFLEGATRGLFTLLFGAGVLLMLRKGEAVGDLSPFEVWTRRCLALLLLGVVQFALFLWPGEILWTYGIAGLALPAFRSSRPRTLLIWAAIILAGLSFLRAVTLAPTVDGFAAAGEAERLEAAGQTLTKEQQAALDAGRNVEKSVRPPADTIAKEREQRTQLGSLFDWSASGWVARHLATFSWPAVAESLAFMLIGMALFRVGILTGEVGRSTYWRLLVTGYGIGLAIRAADLAWRARTGFELDIGRIVPEVSILRTSLYETARLGVTLGHVGLIALLCRWLAAGRSAPIVAMGRMSLTGYSLQSVITSVLFYGFGLFGQLGPGGILLLSLAISAVIALFSVAWLNRYAMGPAEWLLRSIAHGTRRPLLAPGASPRRVEA